MKRKHVARLAGVAVVFGWVICAVRYATVGGGAYNGDIFVPLLLLAVALSAGAGLSIAQAWNGASGTVAAMCLSVLAIAAILVLALAIGLRG